MIKYRPDIDGLRAISVISVLIYHADFDFNGLKILTGGFLGVDIFFVISGYLISSLILKEFQLNNSFSFKNFYNRRIRRIIPLLIIITLITIPIAYLYLLPYHLIEFSNSIFFSTFFLSNFFFIFDGFQYGSDLSISKPFLHTWSLSVEEQFYLFFPLLTFFFLKIFRKYLVHFFTIILIVSLISAELGSNNNQLNNFYFLTSRIWEIFFGVIVSFLHHKKLAYVKNVYFIDFLSIISLFIILGSFILFENELEHPSFLTLIPVLATSSIIYLNINNTLVNKFLSLNFLVYTGLISYSLYLWHFPILSFIYLLGLKSNLSSFFALIFSFPVSILTYNLIEKKFRNLKKISNKFCYSFLFLSVSFICIFVFFSLKSEGFNNRSNILFKKDLSQKPWEILKNSKNEICHLKTYNFCKFIHKNIQKNIFLLGDSHMITLGKPLYNYSVEKKINFTSMTNGGCYFFPNFDYINPNTQNVVFGCDKKYQLSRMDEILDKKESIIIMGGNLNRYLSNTNLNGSKSDFVFDNSDISLYESFKRNLDKILKNNKVILIYPIPEIPFNPLNEIYEKSNTFNYDHLIDFVKKNELTTSLENYLMRSKDSFKFLDSLENKNLFKIYPHKVFCNNEVCLVHNKERLFYFDSEHLSISGANKLADLIIKKIEEIKF
ncbi:acyltransferase [Pelagibacterales bacterium SAG-MED39]|nr:acyltransferase [Pelagibacterales bacterium SAG-MED39]